MKKDVKSYSEKEIMIFGGVLVLAEGRKNLHSVTVQDIADSAGVGKGTIYDYFSSKEEILSKTIIYSIKLTNETAAQAVNSADTFKEKIFAVYDCVMSSVGNSLSAFNLMLYMGGMGELCQVVKNNEEDFAFVNAQSKKLFVDILKVGIKSGDILPKENSKYIEMAISANVIAVGKAALEQCGEGDWQKIKDNAYKMLIKTLN